MLSPRISCCSWLPPRLSLLLLLLLFSAGRLEGLKCFTGDSFSRVADVPLVTCNSSLQSQCQFVCERMQFTNSTDGGLLVVDVCRYGCASAAECQAYTSFKAGIFDLEPVCDCSWSTDDAFWTSYNMYGRGPKFCCPRCYLGLSYSPQSCPSTFSLDQGCCAGDGCNLNGGWKMGRSELFWLGPFVSFCVALVMG